MSNGRVGASGLGPDYNLRAAARVTFTWVREFQECCNRLYQSGRTILDSDKG